MAAILFTLAMIATLSSFYFYGQSKYENKLEKYLYVMIMNLLILLISIIGFITTSILMFLSDNTDSLTMMWGIFLISIFIFLFFSLDSYEKYKSKKERMLKIKKIRNNIENNNFISIKDFYLAYSNFDFKGIYILKNVTKQKYYVGKSINVVKRVKNHIQGRGNAHLFADLKYGDIFTIHLINYSSKFSTLGQQEKFYIEVFDSYNKGYNRNRG